MALSVNFAYLSTDKAGPTNLNLGESLHGFNRPASNRNGGDERRAEVEKLLKADPRKVLKSAERGDVDSLFAFYFTEVNYPEDMLPDLFRVAALHLDPHKLEAISKQIKSVESRKNTTSSFRLSELEDSVNATFKLALGSLGILRMQRMRSAVKDQQSVFNALINKHWPNIFSAMKVLHRLHSDGDMITPRTKMGLASFICGAVGTIFQNDAAFQRLKSQALVQKFLWTMWLYGGPPSYDQDDCEDIAAPARAIAKIHVSLKLTGTLLQSLRQVCGEFGGHPTIAEIALEGVCGALSSKTHVADALQHAFVLTAIISEERELENFVQAAHALDGMARMIDALTDLLTDSRAEIAPESGLQSTIEMLLKIIEHLASRNHRYMEQAARCGLLQLFVALDPSKGDLDPLVLDMARYILGVIPRFFVYHSVIGAFGDEMRKLTEGRYPKDECLLDGELSKEWRELKRVLLDRYSAKRFYDIVASPASKVKHCNNCGEEEDREKFLACSGCKQVFYCSKRCQTEDWKLDGHREECKQGTARYIHDTPFLCFLANLYVGPRSEFLMSHRSGKVSSLSRSVFRLDFTCDPVEPLLDVRDVDVAKNELRGRIARPIEDIPLTAKNAPKARPTHHRRWSVDDIEETPECAQIEITVPDCIEEKVVRYVKLAPEMHFLDSAGSKGIDVSTVAGKNGIDFLCPCCTARVRVGAVNPRDGYLIPARRDVVDLIFAEVHTRGEGIWMCRAKGWNVFKADSHVFDEIDRYIRTCLNVNLKGFEVPDFKL
ncbi:hypothetical protein SCHPADRAFT_502406 [Schizopora paradoxa]|uniref:MYND-type domain-containing protein n=1 Tax=Schizopora paradoxa TaxID=27342 RepID=A0A0H2RGR6_9AGAM|nr:hypothetical protein SCHPADRAFT_502406 [Schizopora paradoxa]